MAGPTFGGHGGGFGGSTFTGTAKKKAKKKGRSWYGGLKNAVHDVEDMAVGATVGTAQMVGSVAQDLHDATMGSFRPRQGNKSQPFKRTSAIADAIAKNYADFYGPLTEGDWKTFLDNVYEHPLQLPLDAATVASLGVGGVARVGLIPAKAGIRLELTMANGEKVLTKPLARGEMRAQLQALTAKAKNAEVKVGPYERPAGMAAAKVQRTKLTRQTKNVQAQNAAFNRELRKLRGKPDKVTAFLLGRFDRQGLNEYMVLLRGEASKNPKGPAAITLKLIENPRVQKRFDVPTPKVQKVLDEARGLGEKQKGLLNIDDATAEAARYRPARIAGGARLEDGEWKGGPSIAELKARGLDPIYFPDVDTVRPPVLAFNAGGGKGLPKAPGATKQNTGALMLAGQLVHDPAVLNKSWLESVKFQHYKDTHASLVEMASESPDIPAGYQAIRELPSERVPHMDKTRGEFMKAIDDEGVFRQDAPTMTTRSPDTAARIKNGNYLVVPDKIVKQMTGEFTRQNEFIRIMNRYPLKVWRALVLGLRPAWLVNNVVGNTMMYMVHSARPEDLKALAGAFKEFATPKQHKAFDQILDKHFAGQTQGGFVASEFPSFSPQGIGRYGSRLQKTTAAVGRGMGAVASALPRIDKRWEQALRKAKVKAELRRNPELRAVVEQLGRETAEFEDLMTNPSAAALDDTARLHSPARDEFVKEMGTRFPGQQTDDIMAMTDLFAAYSARTKGIPLEQAYDDLVKGVTGAEAEAGALAQDLPDWQINDGQFQADMGRIFDTASTRKNAIPPDVTDKAGFISRAREVLELGRKGVRGRYWYRDSGREIASVARGNKDMVDKLTAAVAYLSATDSVNNNVGHALRAYKNWVRSGDVGLAGKYPNNQRVGLQKLFSGDDFQGTKTGSFYKNILKYADPDAYKKKFGTEHVTVDRWVVRAFGWDDDNVGLKGRYQAAEDAIMSMAKQLGWEPEELQAAIWVGVKDATAKAKKGTSDGAFHVGSGMRQNNFQLRINFEGAPGSTTKGLEDYWSWPRWKQEAFTRDVTDASLDYFSDLGLPVYRGAEGPGVYRNPAGELETNPGTAVTIPVGSNPKVGSQVAGDAANPVRATLDTRMLPEDRAFYDGIAAGLGKATKQNAVPWLKPMTAQNAADRTLFHVKLGRVPTADEMKRLVEMVGDDWQIAGSHADDGVFLSLVKDAGMDQATFSKRVRDMQREVFPQSDLVGYAHEGGYLDNDWTHGSDVYDRAIRDSGRGAEVAAASDRLAARVADSFERHRQGAAGEGDGGALRQDRRGAFDAGSRLIHLFDQADPSTAIHEFVHSVDTGGGFTPEHISALEDWSGAQHGTREFSEAAAQGFEQYLREGRAPTDALASLFARWKALLSRIYSKATQLGRPISSEVRAVFDDILAPPQHTPNPHGPINALDQALIENPDLVYQIYDRVNDALGDFDHMSPAERSTLRSLFPFYSWFKAIAGISAKLTVEQPLKVNVFSNLGRIAIESSLEEQGIPRDEWPQSLMGMLGMHKDSDGRISGFSTAGLNPYMTVAQLGAFGAALASLKPGEAGRTLPGLNPLLTDLGSYVWGESPQGYQVHGVGTVETLPFSRLLKAFELTYGVNIPWLGPASSKDPLYEHNFGDESLRYLGVPYARVSPSAAKRTVADR